MKKGVLPLITDEKDWKRALRSSKIKFKCRLLFQLKFGGIACAFPYNNYIIAGNRNLSDPTVAGIYNLPEGIHNLQRMVWEVVDSLER